MLDITGKAYGVPVCMLFGGPIRERIPVYWSHFGTYRVRSAALMGVPALNSYDDLATPCTGGEIPRLPRAENQHAAHPERQTLGVLQSRLRPHGRMAGTELGQPAVTRRARVS